MEDTRQSIPEITVKAFLLGVILSVILAAANAYLGLFAGMTVSASIPAAVVSMGVLRLFRRSSILENNIVQTAASAGESVAAGVIYTLPAMILLGSWEHFNFWWVTLIAGFGGVLGVMFTIPLRRSFIVSGDLKYPEGVATAEVLETGQHGRGVRHLVYGSLFSGLFKLGAGGIGLWPGVVETARRIGGSIFYFGSNLSPALLSVGYIVGLNISILIFLGGALNWFIAIPIAAMGQDWPMDAAGQALSPSAFAYTIWSGQTRYLGVGGMLIGGLWTIFQMRKSLMSGILGGLKAYKDSDAAQKLDRTERDIPMKWVLIMIAGSVIPLFLLYQTFVHQVHVSLCMAVIMLVTGFVFSGVAAYMAGLVGSSNNPLSGLTIATVVLSAVLLVFLMGSGNKNGPAAAIIIGSVVCCAGAIAGDNMQDLKAGQLVGATPYRQQIMQLVGTLSAALVMGPVMVLLQNAYGFAGMPGAGEDALPAPQANLMASIAQGVFGGQMPWRFVWMGVGVGAVIIAADGWLKARRSEFRMPVLAVAIGIYLPFELAVPIFAGGLIHYAANKGLAKAAAAGRGGLLFASGLITGEALMGILLAIPMVILKQHDRDLPLWDLPHGAVLGIAVLGWVAIKLYRIARKPD